MKNLLYFKVMIRIAVAVNMKNFGFDGDGNSICGSSVKCLFLTFKK